MTIKLRVAAGVASLILGVAGVAVMAQDREDGTRAADGPKDFVVQSLGSSAGATDVWSVQCPIGTGRVVADVNDNGGVDGVRMNVTIVNPQGRATGRTSPDNGVSAQAALSGLSGNYLVVITKTGASGVEAYDSIIHCQTSIGGAIAHNVVLVQNQ